MPVGVVEAKRKAKDVAATLEQSRRYSRGYAVAADQTSPGGPWEQFAIPFLFATNGRPFLRQLVTKSGIWFLDGRRAVNLSRPLEGWYTPDGLAAMLKQDHRQGPRPAQGRADRVPRPARLPARRHPRRRGRHRARPARVPGRDGHRHRQDPHLHRPHLPPAQEPAVPPRAVPGRPQRARRADRQRVPRGAPREPADLRAELRRHGPDRHHPGQGDDGPRRHRAGHGQAHPVPDRTRPTCRRSISTTASSSTSATAATCSTARWATPRSTSATRATTSRSTAACSITSTR